MSKANIVLIGMRGSGKSTIGKELAKRLERNFIDLDEEIEKYANQSISEIVKNKGWDYFRTIEQKICTIFAKGKNLVIATGGGIVENEENIKNLKKSGIIIYLKCSPKICAERIKNSNRPSLTGKNIEEELEEIYKKRKEKYEKAADIVIENSKDLKHVLNKIPSLHF